MRFRLNSSLVQIREGLLIGRFCACGLSDVGLHFFDSHRDAVELLAPHRLRVSVVGDSLGLLHRRLGQPHGDCIIGRVDQHEKVALAD